jgi:glycosyltransferase involved in cell wall biosynthesis
VAEKTEVGTASERVIPELSVVMPALNEEDALPVVIPEAVAALDEICDRWEIIVVDDGSTDRTPEILAEFAARDPRIRVLSQHGHTGYGLAIRRGFEAVRYMVVCLTDSDGQFDLRDAARLYPFLKDADMVGGFRISREDNWVRRRVSATYNWLQSRILGLDVRDVNCALKLFRSSFLYMIELTSDGFLIDAEIYARAHRAGLRWAQLGVSHMPRVYGESKVHLGLAFGTLLKLWKLRRSL